MGSGSEREQVGLETVKRRSEGENGDIRRWSRRGKRSKGKEEEEMRRRQARNGERMRVRERKIEEERGRERKGKEGERYLLRKIINTC